MVFKDARDRIRKMVEAEVIEEAVRREKERRVSKLTLKDRYHTFTVIVKVLLHQLR